MAAAAAGTAGDGAGLGLATAPDIGKFSCMICERLVATGVCAERWLATPANQSRTAKRAPRENFMVEWLLKPARWRFAKSFRAYSVGGAAGSGPPSSITA